MTRLLGREIKPETVQSYRSSGRRLPKSWAAAVGVAEQPSATSPSASVGSATGEGPPSPVDGEGRRSEQPPKKPADAKLAPTAAMLTGVAKQRIAELHVFAGAGVATLVDADGFNNDTGVGAGIGLLWKDKADPIAEAWIKWAEEGNKFAQSFVRLMSTGGAGGELVLGYAALLGGTAYLLGHIPDNEVTRFAYGRYSQYRVVVPEPRPAADDGGDTADFGGFGGNGAASAGAGDPLGTATRTARS